MEALGKPHLAGWPDVRWAWGRRPRGHPGAGVPSVPKVVFRKPQGRIRFSATLHCQKHNKDAAVPGSNRNRHVASP